MTSPPYFSSLSSVTPSICRRTPGSEESFSVIGGKNENRTGEKIPNCGLLEKLFFFPHSTSDLLQGGSGEDVEIVKAEGFAELLAQIRQLLQTLLNLLLSLGHVLGHGSLLFTDTGGALRLVKLHLQMRTLFLVDS